MYFLLSFSFRLSNFEFCFCSPKNRAPNLRLHRRHKQPFHRHPIRPHIVSQQHLPKLQHARSKLPQHWPHEFHQQAAHRAGKRVPLQQVLDQGAADRNCVSPPAERDTGENLVSKQEDEAEEADEGGLDTSGTVDCELDAWE